MFYLRRIKHDNVIINIALGKTYVYINKDISNQEFKRWYESLYEDDEIEDCFGFVINFDGNPIALFRDSEYYIMTENGKTFESLK